MSSEIESMDFMTVERSYTTPPGWRLATFEEAKEKIDSIKQQALLKERQRARLLDGWISGPHYDFEMGDNFRSCMDYMLLTRTHTPGDSRGRYADVTLTPKGKDVALLLCREDWNYEVLYSILNSWDTTESESMDPVDVREGRIPFSDTTTFREMNRMISLLARKLGEERPASEIAANRKLKLSPHSLQDLIVSMGKSCWNKFNEQDQKILGRSFLNKVVSVGKDLGFRYFAVDSFEDFVSQGDVADAVWNCVWYCCSSYIIAEYAEFSLGLVIQKWADDKSRPVSRSQRNFILSSSILSYLSHYQKKTRLFDMDWIVKEASKHAADDPQHCKDMLQNPQCRYYEETGNYHVLNQILIFAVVNGDTFVVNKVLGCGAQPQASPHSGNRTTALSYACFFKNKEIARSLLDKCHTKEHVVNAADEKGMTALHFASRGSDASMCELVLSYGGRPDVQDREGRLPLQEAVEREVEEVLDVLIGIGNNDIVQSPDVSDFYQKRVQMVNCKDNNGESPLDVAVRTNNIKIMAKLLSISEQPLEAYFDKVNPGKLLAHFSFEGNADIVKKLLESGANPLHCDEEGKTALHYAALSQDDGQASAITSAIVFKCQDKENLVAKGDNRGKTALHFAAMKGHVRLSWLLVRDPPPIENMKDHPLYDAVKGKHDDPEIIPALTAYRRGIVDDVVDRRGVTVLHVAASEGKVYLVDALLSRSRRPKKYAQRGDIIGQTALLRAAKGGHRDTIIVLLHWGADPFEERDCDGRTALHYAVQSKTGEDGIALAELLLRKCGSNEKKLLFLWASAAGLGSADQNLDDSPLKDFLLKQKEDMSKAEGTSNLLRIAARLGDVEMTKELLTRGFQIREIQDEEWRNNLEGKARDNVEKVCSQIETIAEQGNDKPAVSDNLGRTDFAHGLAALLLNPLLPWVYLVAGAWENPA